MRRTRILATLGPASIDPPAIRRLLMAGADAFRINFAHGTAAQHRTVLRAARREAASLRREVGLDADMPGPKMRIGDLGSPTVSLSSGQTWRIDATGAPGSVDRVSVTDGSWLRSARRGDRILIGDGNAELSAERLEGRTLVARVVHGGLVSSRAGLYLPNARLRGRVLRPNDDSALRLAVDEGADYVGLSFVRNERDVREARRRLDRVGGTDVGLIAKIERAEAVAGIDGIVRACDAMMVARGDLGIELPLERLALEQKRLVSVANAAARPVIVATQMLLSMVRSPRPTRAEATDAANAVLDGADVLMLSEESAIGAYPAEAVSWLDRICRATESAVARGDLDYRAVREEPGAVDRSVASLAARLADQVGASAIVVPTDSGRTARFVASRRPAAAILAVSDRNSTRRKLSLTWGVRTHPCGSRLSLVEMRTLARTLVRKERGLPRDRPIVVTAGYPVGGRATNLVTVVGPTEGETPGGRRARRADR